MRHRTFEGKGFWSLSLALFLTVFSVEAYGQAVTGVVTDGETGQVIEGATITLMRGDNLMDFALTDAGGKFSIAWKYADTLMLNVHSLSYEQAVYPVSKPTQMSIRLKPEAIALKEVEIEGGRVVMRGDTIRYDLSRYATDKDVYVKDVLRKLPGIDVQESGRVTYNGKAIDHLLVEGMDLTGGRYNQITNNLTAKSVRTAEIMQNYRAIKAMGESLGMDEVALNLKLDPDARDQWIVNLQAGAGYGDEMLWEGRLNTMQLGYKQQSLYSYRTNNTGNDLTTELLLLTGTNNEVNIPSFLSQSSISAPLARRRLLFNSTHTLSGNRMYQWGEDNSLRLQAGYTFDRTTQERWNSTVYYIDADSVRIDETYRLRLIDHNAFADMCYEKNSPLHYIAEKVHAEAETTHGTSASLAQKMHTAQLKVTNDFKLIGNRGRANYEVDSRIQYSYLPSSLRVDEQTDRYRQHDVYTDNYFNYQHKRNGITSQLRVGIQANWGYEQTTTDGEEYDDNRRINTSGAMVYLTPGLQIEREKLKLSLSAPLKGKRYFEQSKNYFLYNPRLNLTLTPNQHWKLTVGANISRTIGNATDLYTPDYRKNYRTYYQTNGLMPTSLSQSYSLSGEYKKPIRELFANFSLRYQNRRHNTIYNSVVTTDSTWYERMAMTYHTEGWTANGAISKGVFAWKMKFSVSVDLSRQEGKQMTNSLLQTYRYDVLNVGPQLSWDPVSLFSFEYRGSFSLSSTRIGSDTELDALFNMTHQAKMTFTIGRRLDLIASAEAYSNDLGNGERKNTFLADLSMTYRQKRWRINAALRNLFDKDAYTYTTYSTTQSRSSWLGIRPRELTVSATYQF